MARDVIAPRGRAAIRQRRQELGSLAKASASCGLSVAHISRVERGMPDGGLSLDAARRLADYLGVETGWLIARLEEGTRDG